MTVASISAQKCYIINLFTDTVAMLNSFDLRGIIGCPGGIGTFRLYFRGLFGNFFLMFSKNKIVIGNNILAPCLDVILIAFFLEKYTVKDHISNTKLEKGDHYYLHPNTAQGSFFPLQSYSKKTLRQNVPKSARKYKRNVLMPPGHPVILLKSN